MLSTSLHHYLNRFPTGICRKSQCSAATGMKSDEQQCKAVSVACKHHNVQWGWSPCLVSDSCQSGGGCAATGLCALCWKAESPVYCGIIYQSNWMKKTFCSLELNHPWRDELITNTVYSTNYSVAGGCWIYKAGLQSTSWAGGNTEHTYM